MEWRLMTVRFAFIPDAETARRGSKSSWSWGISGISILPEWWVTVRQGAWASRADDTFAAESRPILSAELSAKVVIGGLRPLFFQGILIIFLFIEIFFDTLANFVTVPPLFPTSSQGRRA
jgi:hypothetical protein